jgi:hypothetical protein
MRRLFSTIAIALFTSVLLAAAGLDGKWKIETELQTKKRGKVTATSVLDLKSEGGKLTGTVTASAGKRDRTLDITDGKVDGNQISFTTVQKTKKREVKLLWKGTIEGDTLKLTRSVEGRREQSLTAKRM